MPAKLKNSKEGKADSGLLFVAGIFFLTLAFAAIYFSHFGLEPLSKSNKMAMTSAAALSSPESASASDEAAIPAENANEKFFSSLEETPVKEIFIGSYGVVDKDILEKLRSRVERIFGIRVTLLSPGPAIPKEEPFYNKTRGQYNSDILIKSVEQSSSTYGKSVRFLYVVDLELASFSEWAPAPSWIRANSGSNAALLSIHDFYKDINNKKTSEELLLERAEKSAMRALGITVGFDVSPSVADTSCVMRQILTVEELDAQKNAFCSPEIEALAQVFQK